MSPHSGHTPTKLSINEQKKTIESGAIQARFGDAASCRRVDLYSEMEMTASSSPPRAPRNRWGAVALAVAVLVLALEAAGQLLTAVGPEAGGMAKSTYSALTSAFGASGTILSLAVLLLAVFGFAQDTKSKLTSATAFAIGLAVLASTLFNAVFVPLVVS